MLEKPIEMLLICGIVIGMLYTFIQLLISFHEISKSRKQASAGHFCPPVSILKPLKGLDDQLEKNLQSFFQLDYPQYELIFGLQEATDPGYSVVEEICAKHPHIKTRVVVNRCRIGLNPKINNLHNIYPHSRYDYIAISDSNVRVAPDYLKKLIAILCQENVGLVTASVRGMNAKKLGSVFENLHLNTFIAGGVLVASRLFKVPVSIGKSMLMKRATIEKIGGFANFRNYLAEDYFMSKAIEKLGLQIVNSAYFVENVNENWSWRYFMNRHTRWAQMRKTTNRLYYLAEILSYPIAISLFYAFYLGNLTGVYQFCLIAGLKIIMDVAMGKIVGSDLRWYQYLLIPIKEVVIAMLWCVPFINSRVNWRGNRFKIIKDTRLIPLLEAT